jgi:hypothetical protein
MKIRLKVYYDSLNISRNTIKSNWSIVDNYVKTQTPENRDNIKKKIREILDKIPVD